MVEFLRAWVTNIAIIIIFVMLMEIILPNSSMKRFINVIVGLLIILVVIKPFVMLSSKEQLFNFKVIETSIVMDKDYIDGKGSELRTLQKQEALKLFEDNLKERIKLLLLSQGAAKAEDIDIEIKMNRDYESETFGKIEGLAVKISDSRVKAIEVGKIEIGSGKSEEINKTVINGDNVEYKLSNDELAGEVKSTISKALGLDEKIVSVFVQE